MNRFSSLFNGSFNGLSLSIIRHCMMAILIRRKCFWFLVVFFFFISCMSSFPNWHANPFLEMIIEYQMAHASSSCRYPLPHMSFKYAGSINYFVVVVFFPLFFLLRALTIIQRSRNNSNLTTNWTVALLLRKKGLNYI